MYDIAESIIKGLFEKLGESNTRALKRWGIFIVVGAIATYIVLNFSFVFIGVSYGSGVSPSANVSLTASSSTGESGLINLFGLGIISRQTSAVTAKSDTHSTTAAIEVPWMGFASKQLILQSDKNVDKVSGPSPECTAYDSKHQKILSFSCSDPKYLVSAITPNQDKPFWDNRIETTLPDGSIRVAPYANGIIGISRNKDRSLFYSDSSGNVTYIAPPSDLDYDQLLFSKLGNNQVDPASNRFTIAAPTGDIYVGSLTEQGTYAKFPHVKDFDQYQDISACAPTELAVYCYFGKGRSAKTSKLTDSIVTMKLFNNKIAFEKLYFDKDIALDTIYTTASNTLFGLSDNTLYLLKKESGYLHPQAIATSVRSVSSGTTLSYVKDNSVFTFNENQGLFELEFTSPHLDITRVDSFGGEKFITGKIKNTTFYHKYKLNGQLHGKNETRLVDIIPFESNKSEDTAAIVKSDYFDNTVAVQVTADITSNKRTGKTTVNEQAFAMNKENALNTLAEMNITSPNFTLIFTK